MRRGWAVALGLLVLSLLASPSAQARKRAVVAPPKLVVVPASADASARADAPDRRSGTLAALRVDGDPTARTFVRFKLTGLTGKVVRTAFLWVHLARTEPWKGLAAGGTNRRAWSERTLSWRARPAAGPATGTAARAVGTLWRKIDVTPLVRQNGTVDVALSTTAATGLELSSREAARRFAPRLHLLVVPESQPGFPVRGAFYSARYPAGWSAGTQYHPAAGRYDGAASSVIAGQLAGLDYGRFNTAIVPWSGPRTASDQRDTELLGVTDFLGSPVKWAFQARIELLGDPSPGRIAAQLAALDEQHGRDPAYLRVRGRPVVFVPVETEDTCDAVDRWVKGNATSRFYLVFDTVKNYGTCTSAPSDWYHVDPSARSLAAGRSSMVAVPGEFDAGTSAARLPRDLSDFALAVRSMAASRLRFQLVSSYDGWADGTALEPATEWASPSGYGQYLDVLHAAGTVPTTPPVTLEAAGDIACGVGDTVAPDTCKSGATALLIQGLQPAAVLPLGDDQYPQGALSDFQAGYATTWGRFNAIAHPVPGNHEYCDGACADPAAAAAAGYFTYFGASAGTPGQGWYSYDLGSWHVIALNSECPNIGGCGTGSPEETWLRADLAAHPAACTLAYWHRPRFTGGHEGETPSMGPIWTDLYQAGVELVLNGHQHQYERFQPQSPSRVADASGGILEIVSGSGGRSHVLPATVRANTVVQNADSFGVTQVQLGPLGFSWQFLSAPELGTFSDSGTGHCH